MSWRERLKHAFAVEEKDSINPHADQVRVVDIVAREIARRRLTTPALVFLEMSRPINYVASQAMHFLQPIASVVLDTGGYEQFAKFLEHRGSIDFLCRRIEHFEAEFVSAEEKPQMDADERG
jgi:precorrin-6B methylase 2